MRLSEPDFLRPSRGVPAVAWILLALAAAALVATSVRAGEAWQMRAQGREEAARQAVLRALEAPWRQRFEAVESAAAAGVNWLSMDIGPSGELRLIGEATDGAQPIEVAERLRSAGLWRTVVVSRSERSAAQGQRFEIRGEAAEAGP